MILLPVLLSWCISLSCLMLHTLSTFWGFFLSMNCHGYRKLWFKRQKQSKNTTAKPTQTSLEQQSMNLLADTLSGAGVCVFELCSHFTIFFSPIQISQAPPERGTVSAHQLGIHRRSKGEYCCLFRQGAWLIDVDVCYVFLSCRPEPYETFFPPSVYTNSNRAQRGLNGCCH